jgi:hypothetical protein
MSVLCCYIGSARSIMLLYNSVIISRIDYCSSLLIFSSKESQSKLQQVINLATQIISGYQCYNHITSVLNDLEWWLVKKRVAIKVAILGFKCRTSQFPLYLSHPPG